MTGGNLAISDGSGFRPGNLSLHTSWIGEKKPAEAGFLNT